VRRDPSPLSSLTDSLWVLTMIVALGIAFTWSIKSGLQAANDTVIQLNQKAIAYGKAHGGYQGLTVRRLAGVSQGPSLYLVRGYGEACVFYAGAYFILSDPASDQVRLYQGQCPFGGAANQSRYPAGARP
jgi:hypothetical protein